MESQHILRNQFVQYVLLFTFSFCNATFADEKEDKTTVASGVTQIVVSPINLLIDLGELTSANAIVLDKDGNPIEGYKLQIIPQDNKMIAIKGDSFVTNESGYVQFSILAKREGDTTVNVSDGITSVDVNVAVGNLIHLVLPYYYGNMQLCLINPFEDVNYARIQFHESSDRFILPIMMRLEGKEMKTVNLSEEMDVALMNGWVEIMSTDIIFGGVWTNKGYLPMNQIEGHHYQGDW
jgi:hypothetical protein